MKTEISLKDLLDTTFTINDDGEMVGEFTLKKINIIGDILTQQNEEIERLNNIINELEKMLEQTIENSVVQPHIEMAKYTLKELKELKGSDKE